MQVAQRVQTNIVSRRERQLIDWICVRLPRSVTPDQLTMLGFVGAVVVFIGYLASRWNPAFLWLASFGFITHWFGDSLDGSLARYRRCERPQYGYFLDHSVDALCNLIIMVGLGLTVYVRMDASLFTLLGYYMLCMYVFLNNHVTRVFQLSFLGLGPTELRLALIGINIWMYICGPNQTLIAGNYFSGYDLVLIAAGCIFVLIFVYRTALRIQSLRD